MSSKHISQGLWKPFVSIRILSADTALTDEDLLMFMLFIFFFTRPTIFLTRKNENTLNIRLMNFICDLNVFFFVDINPWFIMFTNSLGCIWLTDRSSRVFKESFCSKSNLVQNCQIMALARHYGTVPNCHLLLIRSLTSSDRVPYYIHDATPNFPTTVA